MQKQQTFLQLDAPLFGSHRERRLWSHWVLANLAGEFVSSVWPGRWAQR
jgi:hypothetical protein